MTVIAERSALQKRGECVHMHLVRAIALSSAFGYVRIRNFQRGIPMAEETPTGPVEMGADMDYAEHEKTYSIFLFMTKYGIIVCSALMLSLIHI